MCPQFTDKYHIFKKRTISNLRQVKQMYNGRLNLLSLWGRLRKPWGSV